MTSVDIVVWIISLALSPQQDLTMSHGHGVDNFSLDCAGKVDNWIWGEQISGSDFLAESAARFPSVLGVCVRIRSRVDGDDSDSDGDGDGNVNGNVNGDGPEALRQVGWLHQRQRQSFHWVRAFYWPKIPQTKSFPPAQSFRWKAAQRSPTGKLESWKYPGAFKVPQRFQLISDFRAGESLKSSYVNSRSTSSNNPVQ